MCPITLLPACSRIGLCDRNRRATPHSDKEVAVVVAKLDEQAQSK